MITRLAYVDVENWRRFFLLLQQQILKQMKCFTDV